MTIKIFLVTNVLSTQDELDNPIRDLCHPKDSAELLASMLKERNLLLPCTKITVYREQEFVNYFKSENSLYCHDIERLINIYIKKDYIYNPDH